MRRRRGAEGRRGAAMVEMALSLALFTPLVLAGLRLAEGTNQMHDLAAAVNDAARAGGACASQEEIRAVAMSRVRGLQASNVVIAIDRASEPALIRVSIEGFRVQRLSGSEPLPVAPSAAFPYTCQH